MNDLNHLISLASEGLEARKNSDDEIAFNFLKQLFLNAIPKDILDCNADFLLGKSFLQMLYLDIAENFYEYKKIAEFGYFLLTKSILKDPSNPDKIMSRANLVLKNENVYETLVKEAIEHRFDEEDRKNNILVIPSDAVLLMLQYDFYKLGNYCNIFSAFVQKQSEINEMHGNNHFRYIAPDLNILGLGQRYHNGLYQFIKHRWFDF